MKLGKECELISTRVYFNSFCVIHSTNTSDSHVGCIITNSMGKACMPLFRLFTTYSVGDFEAFCPSGSTHCTFCYSSIPLLQISPHWCRLGAL